MPDINVAAASAITALVPIVVPFLVYYARQVFAFIPKQLSPLLAVGFGLILTYLDAFVANDEWNVIVGAGLGALGVAVREMYKFFTE